MKKILSLLLAIVLVTRAHAQLGIGGGIGVLDTSGMAIQIKLDYTFKFIGIRTGFITAPSPSAPCYFNIEINPVIKLSNSAYILPHGGYVYRLVTNDNKELNGSSWIAGITYENGIADQAILYMDASLVNGRSFSFIIGMKYLFWQRSDCN